MSLYKQWTDMVVEYVKTKGEAAFWNEYTKIETSIYRDLLANSKETIKTTIADFAKAVAHAAGILHQNRHTGKGCLQVNPLPYLVSGFFKGFVIQCIDPGIHGFYRFLTLLQNLFR